MIDEPDLAILLVAANRCLNDRLVAEGKANKETAAELGIRHALRPRSTDATLALGRSGEPGLRLRPATPLS